MSYVSCPFNAMHRVPQDRLQWHVIKCAKNYPGYVMCTYNALHRFKTNEEMLEHLKTCRNNIPPILTTEEITGPTISMAAGYESQKFHLKEENWNLDY